jgi:glucokinase
MAYFRVGVDLGGTNIKAGAVDENNRIAARASRKTLPQRGFEAVADDIAAAAADALKAAGGGCGEAYIGIGSPGTVDAENGTVVFAGNLGWERVPLAKAVSERSGMKVYLGNDADCAALGEYIAGAAKNRSSALLLTLGTGVGGGAVFGGKIFAGGGLGGAEFGHIILVSGGERCTCGRRGCFEAYCSATALIRDAKRAALENTGSMLNSLCGGDLEKMDGKIPFDAAKAGDAAAKRVVDRYTELLGEGICDLVNLFRPEIVLLSGGVSAQGEYLTEPLNKFLRTHAFAGERVPIPRVETAMLGNDAGMIGAANLKGAR